MYVCMLIDCEIDFTKAYLKMVGLYKLQNYENNSGRDILYVQTFIFTQVSLGLTKSLTNQKCVLAELHKSH